MGVAEIIPGISGGTVALILGIYKRLIDSISQFNIVFLKRIGKHLFKEAFKQVDIYFLFSLFLGMLVAIFSLSSLLSFLLFSHAVFFKFLLSSLLGSSLLLKEIRPLTIDKNLFLGILFSAIIGLSLFATPVIEIESPSSIYIFFAGFLAICALVLPGISGSFILLLIGVYPVIIVSISTLDIVTLSIFSLGCIVGLLSAVRIIKTIYERNRSLMRAFFFGLILFSIPLLWKEDQFLIIIPTVSEFLLEAVIGIFIGMGLIFLLEKART
jgi:putative membrane protein